MLCFHELSFSLVVHVGCLSSGRHDVCWDLSVRFQLLLMWGFTLEPSSNGVPMSFAPMMIDPLSAGLQPGHSASSNTSEVQKQKSYFLLPRIGLLFIDRPFDQADVFLMYKMSYERYRLPAGGDWFSEFDAQGFAAAVDASDQLDCECAEDVLKRQLCRNDGKLWV